MVSAAVLDETEAAVAERTRLRLGTARRRAAACRPRSDGRALRPARGARAARGRGRAGAARPGATASSHPRVATYGKPGTSRARHGGEAGETGGLQSLQSAPAVTLSGERRYVTSCRPPMSDRRSGSAPAPRALPRRAGWRPPRCAITALARSTEGFSQETFSFDVEVDPRRRRARRAATSRSASRSRACSSPTTSSPSSACCTRSPTIRCRRRRRRGSSATRRCSSAPST